MTISSPVSKKSNLQIRRPPPQFLEWLLTFRIRVTSPDFPDPDPLFRVAKNGCVANSYLNLFIN